jgi:hypothetical protein
VRFCPPAIEDRAFTPVAPAPPEPPNSEVNILVNAGFVDATVLVVVDPDGILPPLILGR